MDDMTTSPYSELFDVNALYDEADMFVESEANTLVISGNADDLALIERILLKLQAKKEARTVRRALEETLNRIAAS